MATATAENESEIFLLLDLLSEDVLLLILSFLPAQVLIRLQGISRHFLLLCEKERLWKNLFRKEFLADFDGNETNHHRRHLQHRLDALEMISQEWDWKTRFMNYCRMKKSKESFRISNFDFLWQCAGKVCLIDTG